MIGLAEQDVNLDRFLDVEETLVYHGGYYGMAGRRRRAGREMIEIVRAGRQGPSPGAGALGRHAPAAPARPGADARAAPGDPRRADRRRRLRAAIELWRYIRRLHGEGTTILLTTHYLEEAEELCEEIALINAGQVVARDSTAGLRATYGADSLADVYVKALAGARA